MKSISLTKATILLFGNLTIFFSLFPYIGFIGFNTNTQPNALITSIPLIILLKKEKYPLLIFYNYLILIVATIVLLFSHIDQLSLRDWANYLSLAIVTHSLYLFICYRGGDFFAQFNVAVYLWLFTALIQFFIFPDFLSFIVSSSHGSLVGGRGVTSLAPEPTYYGFISLSLLVIYIVNNWYYRDKVIGWILLFQIFFLSRSSTTLLVMFISLALFFTLYLFRLRFVFILKLFSLFIFCIFLIILLNDVISQSRFYRIFSLIIQNPSLVILTDYSVSERLNHLVFPFVGFFENYFIPNGFGTFGEYLYQKSYSENFKFFFVNPIFKTPGRIMNGFGKAFYELGIFGALIPILIFYQYKNQLLNSAKIFIFIVFNVLLCMSFIFMTATIPLMIATMLFVSSFGNSKSSNSGSNKVPL